jgi:hypothetical protein
MDVRYEIQHCIKRRIMTPDRSNLERAGKTSGTPCRPVTGERAMPHRWVDLINYLNELEHDERCRRNNEYELPSKRLH